MHKSYKKLATTASLFVRSPFRIFRHVTSSSISNINTVYCFRICRQSMDVLQWCFFKFLPFYGIGIAS